MHHCVFLYATTSSFPLLSFLSSLLLLLLLLPRSRRPSHIVERQTSHIGTPIIVHGRSRQAERRRIVGEGRKKRKSRRKRRGRRKRRAEGENGRNRRECRRRIRRGTGGREKEWRRRRRRRRSRKGQRREGRGGREKSRHGDRVYPEVLSRESSRVR